MTVTTKPENALQQHYSSHEGAPVSYASGAVPDAQELADKAREWKQLKDRLDLYYARNGENELTAGELAVLENREAVIRCELELLKSRSLAPILDEVCKACDCAEKRYDEALIQVDAALRDWWNATGAQLWKAVREPIEADAQARKKYSELGGQRLTRGNLQQPRPRSSAYDVIGIIAAYVGASRVPVQQAIVAAGIAPASSLPANVSTPAPAKLKAAPTVLQQAAPIAPAALGTSGRQFRPIIIRHKNPEKSSDLVTLLL